MLIKEKINKTRTDLRDSSNHDLMIICMNDWQVNEFWVFNTAFFLQIVSFWGFFEDSFSSAFPWSSSSIHDVDEVLALASGHFVYLSV